MNLAEIYCFLCWYLHRDCRCHEPPEKEAP